MPSEKFNKDDKRGDSREDKNAQGISNTGTFGLDGGGFTDFGEEKKVDKSTEEKEE